MRCRKGDEPICAYRNEKMNQIKALIMIKRKITPATTHVIINVIFERFDDVELGNKSKYSKEENNENMHIMSFSYIACTWID